MTLVLSGLDILVVEDNNDTAYLLEVILTHQGASVRRASCARDGLVMAKKRVPRLVLTDLAMPGEDGYWLLRELRKQLPRAVPVIAVTAECDRDHVLGNGFDGYMGKPIEPQALVQFVAKVVSRDARPAIQGGAPSPFPSSVIVSRKQLLRTRDRIEATARLLHSSLALLYARRHAA